MYCTDEGVLHDSLTLVGGAVAADPLVRSKLLETCRHMHSKFITGIMGLLVTFASWGLVSFNNSSCRAL